MSNKISALLLGALLASGTTSAGELDGRVDESPLGKGILDPMNTKPMETNAAAINDALRGILFLCKSSEDFDLVASTQLIAFYKNSTLNPSKRDTAEKVNEMVTKAAIDEGKDCFFWRTMPNGGKALMTPTGERLHFSGPVDYNVYRYQSYVYRTLTLRLNNSFNDVSPAAIEFLQGTSYKGKLYYFDPIPPEPQPIQPTNNGY